MIHNYNQNLFKDSIINQYNYSIHSH